MTGRAAGEGTFFLGHGACKKRLVSFDTDAVEAPPARRRGSDVTEALLPAQGAGSSLFRVTSLPGNTPFACCVRPAVFVPLKAVLAAFPHEVQSHLVKGFHEQRGVVVVLSAPEELHVAVVGELLKTLVSESLLLVEANARQVL